MRAARILLPAVAAAALAAGCRTSSPYDYVENWLLREDAVRMFAVPADVIYVQGVPYTNTSEIASMSAYAQREVGNGRFSGVARVFSPLVAGADDLELALKWYFRNQHPGNRPFAFIGEGECGALLRQYEESNADGLRGRGLVASFYTPNSHEGFVKDKMVRAIRDAVARMRYREQWGREMPPGGGGK